MYFNNWSGSYAGQSTSWASFLINLIDWQCWVFLKVCLFGCWAWLWLWYFKLSTRSGGSCRRHSVERQECTWTSPIWCKRISLHFWHCCFQNFQVLYFILFVSLFYITLCFIEFLFLNMFCRRKKIATSLLKACDVLSETWGFQYLTLRAYEDDLGAQKLYASAGYKVVSGDPPWMTTWIGKRRRVLMIKCSNSALSS